ncbi:MAG: hypothetical protein NT062_11920, partial [Proteobacteria bacterium]|nr:hypothetical protein [Pseudomonadota bacterium]
MIRALLSPLLVLLALALVGVAAAPAAAQPVVLEPGRCEAEPPATDDTGLPTTWGDYDLAGDLVDPLATVRALLDPTMQQSHALTSSARADIKRAARAFGYHVVGMITKETPTGVRLAIQLAALPLVRKVTVDVDQTLFDVVFDDEIRRRMRLRIGTYLPWAPDSRHCEVLAEQQRLEAYLFEEGYFDATVQIQEQHDRGSIELKVKVVLNEPYQVDTAKIKFVRAPGAPPLLVADAELRKIFVHKGRCLVAGFFCGG